jgi:uncharacterized protein YceK
MRARPFIQFIQLSILGLAIALVIAGCGTTSSTTSSEPPAPQPSTPLTISNVGASSISNVAATIGWTTNVNGTSQVDYGTTAQYGLSSNLDSSLTMTHSASLSGLQPGTLYDFRVRSKDSSGTEVPSANFSFTTLANPPPNSAPVITAVSAAVTVNGATIIWLTDKAADGQVHYGLTTSYGQSSPLQSTLSTSHSVVLSGLNASTTYNYQVLSRDSSNNLSVSGNFVLVTGAAPPLVISNVSALPTTSSATITWSTDSNADDQVDYGTTANYGQSSAPGSALSKSHTVTISGLNASTIYDYRVKSRDAAGNLTISGNFSFTTLTIPTQGSMVLSYINALPTANSATVSWRTSTPSDTQVDFGATSAYGQSTSLDSTPVTLHTAVLSGLTASSTYNFRVKSRSSSGALTTGGNFTFTTTASGASPVVINSGWSALPNTLLQSVCPPNTSQYAFSSNCSEVIQAWSGGIADTARNRLIVWGGGHNDYYGNELYALNLSDSTLVRLNNPSPTADPAANAVALSDGTPNSRHTYGGLSNIAHADRMFVYGGDPAAIFGFASNDTWTLNLATLRWQRMDPTTGGPPANAFGVVSDYDPNTQSVYLHDGQTFWKYQFETNQYTSLDSTSSISIYNAGVIDPKRQLFFIIGSGLQVISIAAGSNYTMQDWTSQVSGCGSLLSTDYPGLAYDPTQDRIVGWTGGATIYTFNPDTKTCSSVSPPGGPGAAQPNGTHGRFRYFPGINAFAVVNDAGENAYIFKF